MTEILAKGYYSYLFFVPGIVKVPLLLGIFHYLFKRLHSRIAGFEKMKRMAFYFASCNLFLFASQLIIIFPPLHGSVIGPDGRGLGNVPVRHYFERYNLETILLDENKRSLRFDVATTSPDGNFSFPLRLKVSIPMFYELGMGLGLGTVSLQLQGIISSVAHIGFGKRVYYGMVNVKDEISFASNILLIAKIRSN